MEPVEVAQTPDEIREALADWKYHVGQRDDLVRAAHEASIQIKEISQLSGLSRTTVYKILGLAPGENTPLSASSGGSGAGNPE